MPMTDGIAVTREGESLEVLEGRTARGFSETSRSLYRWAINDHALPTWRTWKLGEVGPAEVRAIYRRLRAGGRPIGGSPVTPGAATRRWRWPSWC